jgi:hypothetical protein
MILARLTQMSCGVALMARSRWYWVALLVDRALQQPPRVPVQDDFAADATRRALDLTNGLFPWDLKPETPDVFRISVALLARCVTTTEA